MPQARPSLWSIGKPCQGHRCPTKQEMQDVTAEDTLSHGRVLWHVSMARPAGWLLWEVEIRGCRQSQVVQSLGLITESGFGPAVDGEKSGVS